MRIVIVEEKGGYVDESSIAIEQDCKRCGKEFRNKGIDYCSRHCAFMDKV